MLRRAAVLVAILAFVLVGGAPARGGEQPSDESALRQLNADYVRAFLACDVARFREILADDFSGILADGRVIDKAGFLLQAAIRPDVHDLRVREVSIRPFGDAALIAALVVYHRADGNEVRTRYTDVCVRRDGRWRIVSVQWTRVVAP